MYIYRYIVFREGLTSGRRCVQLQIRHARLCIKFVDQEEVDCSADLHHGAAKASVVCEEDEEADEAKAVKIAKLHAQVCLDEL